MFPVRAARGRVVEVVVLLLLVSTLPSCRRVGDQGRRSRDGAAASPTVQASPAVGAPGASPQDEAPTESQRPRPVVSGEIFLREQVSLPHDARVRVRVVRAAGRGSAEQTLAEVELVPSRRLPIPFEVQCDPAAIEEGAAYQVEAQVVRRGTVVFATPAPIPVLAGGAPTTGLKLLLRRVG